MHLIAKYNFSFFFDKQDRVSREVIGGWFELKERPTVRELGDKN